MANLLLIRNKTAWDCWDYYEEMTDVFVIGDVSGFQYFCDRLTAAKTSKAALHLSLANKSDISMCGVIVPASFGGDGMPRLRLLERFVFWRGQPRMELVICGNQPGFGFLADKIRELSENTKEDLDEHFHLNDINDPELLARSVALNVRSPLQTWRTEALGAYGNMATVKGVHFLPADLDYRLGTKERYQSISAKNSEYARIA